MMSKEAENEWLYSAFPKAKPDAEIVYKKLIHSGLIEEFRSAWTIRPEGFSSESTFQKWYSQLILKATDNLQKSKQYNKILQRSRKGNESCKERLFNSQVARLNIKFEDDIDYIMTALKIPSRYRLFVRTSLTCKGMPVDFPLDRDRPIPQLRADKITGRKRLFVEVFSDTKIQDFKDPIFVHELNELQAKLYDKGTIKQLGPKKIDMWSQIYTWHHVDGLSYKQILTKARAVFNYSFNSVESLNRGLTRYRKSMLTGTRTRIIKK